MSHHTNITRIKVVYQSLGELRNKVVFVGGATISLYSERQTFETRPTDDVDVIIELLNYSGRAELEEKLRQIGFTHDVESGVVCRYKIQGIIVDIMPTADESIGFKNKWYPDGFRNAVDYKIDEEISVKILSAPFFIATKLEAFKSRGKRDGRTSDDFEDIVFVLENRRSIWQEMKDISGDLKKYLLTEFTLLKDHPYIEEWIDCHVERSSSPPATYSIMDSMQEFIS